MSAATLELNRSIIHVELGSMVDAAKPFVTKTPIQFNKDTKDLQTPTPSAQAVMRDWLKSLDEFRTSTLLVRQEKNLTIPIHLIQLLKSIQPMFVVPINIHNKLTYIVRASELNPGFNLPMLLDLQTLCSGLFTLLV